MLFLCYCRKQGLRIKLRVRRFDYLYGVELPKQLAGFQGAAPIGGVEGQRPRNQRTLLFKKPSPEPKTDQNKEIPSVQADGPPSGILLYSERPFPESSTTGTEEKHSSRWKSARANLKTLGRVQCPYARRFLASSKPIWCLFKEKNVTVLGLDFTSSFYAIICWEKRRKAAR